MPKLGLGLGLKRGSTVPTPLQLLSKYTSAMWLPSKATGTSEGINSPFTSTVADLKGNAPLLLQGFAGTPTSGYTSEPVIRDNGEPVLFDNLLGADGNMVDSNADNRADGWSYVSSTPISCIGNEVIFLPTVQFGTIRKDSETRAQNINDLLYLCAFIKSTSNLTKLSFSRGSSYFSSMQHNGSGNYEFLSVQDTLLDKTTSRFIVDTNLTSAWSNITVKQAHLFNLTTMFPNPSTRPTKTQMDFLVQWAISKYGYINEQIIKIAWVVMLKYDSTNDYGLASNPSLEILGTSDFGFGRVLSLPTLTTQYFKMKSDSSEATTQYGLKLLNTGVLQIILQGTAIQIATGILANTMYSIWVERISGVLKCFVNGVEVSSVANNTSLTSRANYRDGAMTTAIDGSTLTGYTNQYLGADTIAKENVLQARSAWFKFTLSTFGV